MNIGLSGQQYNPFVDLGEISPKPMLPVEFGGNGVVSFRVGNSGSEDLYYRVGWEMSLVIGLLNGVPNSEDPISALKGEWVDYFNWVYNPTLNSYTGIQKKEIKAGTSGIITVDYKVRKNITESGSSNGFNVNIQPPPYANGENLTGDDSTSKYTFTKATDYGDAPESYGQASSEIYLYRSPSTGNYANFVMLGDTIDHDEAYVGSILANSDDSTGLSDEDGVIFPALYPGSTITIPVVTTTWGGNVQYINAWIDWNGDGDFSDSGEKITNNNFIVGLGRKKTNLTVSIPSNAQVGKTFARFRVSGSNSTLATGHTAWGEVEDYAITIFANSPAIALEKSGIWNDVNNNGRTEVGESITYTFKARNTGNASLTNVEISDPMLSNTRYTVVPSTLLPGQIGTVTAQYILNNDNINSGSVYNTANAFGIAAGNVEVIAESVDKDPLTIGEEGYNESCPTCSYTKISKGNEITGYVWEDGNKNGMLDEGETLLVGQKIILYKTGNIKIDSTESGEDGSYRLYYLENGSYFLKFVPNSGYSFTPEQLDEEFGNKVNNVNGLGTTQNYDLSQETILKSINAGLFLGSLPVSWVKVEVIREDNTNKIQWTVESEKDVEKYLIYRSTDEEAKFKVIGETKPSSDIEGLRKNYSYFDFNATSDGHYYYFVENVDKDGRRSRSRIVSISLIHNTIIDVYPNPASNYLNISIPSDVYGTTEIKLYNENGSLVKNLNKGNGTLNGNLSQFDISDIIPGKYIVKLKVGEIEIDKRIIVIK
jgi:uncharacterized repeat protein (TIGR01451 family)